MLAERDRAATIVRAHPYGGEPFTPIAATLPPGSVGRLELIPPRWRGPCGPRRGVLGTEDHPDDYVAAVVALVAAWAPALAPTGTLWLGLADMTLSAEVRAQPSSVELAAIRYNGRPETHWSRALVPEYGLLGVLGERTFCEQFGGRVYAIPGYLGARDGGADAYTRAGTVGVKTGSYRASRLLLQKSHRHPAAISVAARANANMTAATLMGWDYTCNVVGGETFDPGYGEPAWSKFMSALRPMSALRTLADIRWRPDERLRLPVAIRRALEAQGWLRWGTAWPAPPAPPLGRLALTVFSPPHRLRGTHDDDFE